MADAEGSSPNWRQAAGYREAAVKPRGTLAGGFALLPPQETGIWFTNLLPEARHLTNQILPNGSGVAAADVDRDGWCDLYFCGLKDAGNGLYRNLGGWHFTNVTATAGVACPGLDSTGAAFADWDGDGDADLAVNTLGGGTHLFVNDGRGGFTRPAPPLNPRRGGTSLAFADADGDGDLDLYITNYRVWTLTDAPGTRFGVKMIEGKPTVTLVNGRPLTDPEWTNRFRFKIGMEPGGRGKFAHEELGEPDAYFVNDGHGQFTPVSFTNGAFLDEDGRAFSTPPFDWGLSVLFRDLNGDGAPDLYVCNDFGTPDRLWHNDGTGRFRLAPLLALRQTSLASMAVDAADLDRDGHDDLVVLDMLSRDHARRLTQRNIMRPELAPNAEMTGRPQSARNTLLWNRGDGTYAEIAQFAGIEGTEWSWNPVLVDVDLDGYEDLLVPNGFVRDNMNLDAMNRIAAEKAGRRLSPVDELHLRRLYPPLDTPNLAFRNLGRLRFAECGQAWGFNQTGISQGACLADLDNDGDLDVAVNNLNGVAGIYRNDTVAPRIAVCLRGRPPNTAGLNARITAIAGDLSQTQELVSGGRYCSSDQPLRTFATLAANQVELRVRWRSGRETVIRQVPVNHLVEIAEPPSGDPMPPAARQPPRRSPLLFADVSDALRHRHHDAPFDDFARQPLLPRRLSQLGPGVAWWDLDGDGHDDLVVGPGRGGGFAALRNLGDGRFEPLTGLPWSGPASRECGGLAGWRPATLLVATSADEASATTGPTLFELSRDNATPALSPAPASTEGSPGPLAVADYDGDGDLDLFRGTRAVAGRYPEPGRSRLFRWQDGKLEPDQGNSDILPPALINGAVWTDLTGDGWPELVLACDWGPLRILRNDRGTLSAWDVPVRLAATSGSGDGDAGTRAPPEPRGRARESVAESKPFDSAALSRAQPRLVAALSRAQPRLVAALSRAQPRLVAALSRAQPRLVAAVPGREADDALPSAAMNPQPSTLSHLTGWWNGVAAGDFDNDGRLDLLASNWGANTRYERWRPAPLRLDFGDFNDDGVIEIFENHYVAELRTYAPDRMLDAVTRVLPRLAERFPTHQGWAAANMDAVLGEWKASARQVEAAWLESTLLLNRGDHFEIRTLPDEAQFAPAFAVCIGDADGDGNEDAFLSQNFFGVELETSRYDAGRGLWLRGDGRGGLSPVRGQDCGVLVYGEQRGAALADFDADGRLDFVVTQNSAETRLYRNVGAKSGLRVRLRGPRENPSGIGAVLRLHYPGSVGPAREVRAGSGYWSQDSLIQVLGLASEPTALEARWPGGRVTKTPLPPGVRAIAVRTTGECEVLAP